MPVKLDESDMKLKLAIAQRFKNIRLGTGKSQEDLAHGYGRDKQSLSKNERGKGATIYTISKFCVENGITLSEFFDSEEFAYLKPKRVKS